MSRNEGRKPLDKRHLLVTEENSSTAEDSEGHEPAEHVQDGRRNLSLAQKVLLSAEQLGNEASCTFGDLYIVPTLQTLGMPMKFVSLTGLTGGPAAFFLVLALGWLSDKGSNPRFRKAVAFLLSTGFLIFGLALIVLASGLHLKDLRENVQDQLSNSTAPTHDSDEVPFKAGLGMLGCVLAGIGVTCTHSCINSWVLACSPRAEHTSILVHSLVMASLGGVSTAALGMVDLGTAFHSDMAKEAGLAVQVSAQACVIMFVIIVGTCVSLWMGRHVYRTYVINAPSDVIYYTVDSNSQYDVTEGMVTDDADRMRVANGVCTNSEDHGVAEIQGRMDDNTENAGSVGRERAKTVETKTSPIKPVPSVVPENDSSENNSLTFCYSPQISRKYYGTSDSTCTHRSDTNQTEPNSTVSESMHRENALDLVERNPDAANSRKLLSLTAAHTNSISSRLFSRLGLTDFRWRVALVCLSSYFSTGVIFMFALMSSDYVGKAIYDGDPGAEPGSDSLVRYQAGVRMASWGFLVYYIVYMLFNPFHERVLARVGYKGEFVPIHMLMGAFLVLLAMTARLEIYFLLSAMAGLHRACFYSIPFAVTNDFIQAEAARNRDNGGSNINPRVGLAMSVVTGMIPLAYTTLFPWVGPLEQLSGVVAAPMWLGAAFACLSALTFVTL